MDAEDNMTPQRGGVRKSCQLSTLASSVPNNNDNEEEKETN